MRHRVLVFSFALITLAVVTVLAGMGVAHWIRGSNLAVSASAENWTTVKAAAKSGAPVNTPDRFGNPAIIYASQANETETIIELLQRGAHPNVRNESPGFDWTPLMWVAHHNNPVAAKALLDAGAKMEIRDNKGETALHFAARAESTEVLNLLIRAGADIDARDVQGHTPLATAVIGGWLDGARELLRAGADPSSRGRDGRTPADFAAHPDPAYFDPSHRFELASLRELLHVPPKAQKKRRR